MTSSLSKRGPGMDSRIRIHRTTYLARSDTLGHGVPLYTLVVGSLSLCAFISQGCRPGPSAASADLHGRVSSFVGRGPAVECSAHCLDRTMYIVRAQLGLDPFAARNSTSGTFEELSATLSDRRGNAYGRIQRVDVQEVIGTMDYSRGPLVLLDGNGHAYILIGVSASDDGRKMWRLFHGDAPVSVVSTRQLSRARFCEAWQLVPSVSGVPIRIGTSELRVSSIFHDFGMVPPGERVECEFTIQNAGSMPLVFGAVKTSCSCTTAAPPARTVLLPGKATTIRTAIRPVDSSSLRQIVRLPVFEKGSHGSRQIAFHLCGSRKEAMKIAPKTLDFGIVLPGTSVTRAIRISEVPGDRFSLTGVESKELPLDYKISDSVDGHGLTTYRLRLRFDIPEGHVGNRMAAIRVLTTSHVLSQVVIPVRYEIPPPVQPEPGVVALGTALAGKTYRRVVRFTSRDNQPVDVDILDAPGECDVVVERVANQTEMIVNVSPTKPGLWVGVIRARTRSRSWEGVVEIKCAGYVRATTPDSDSAE